MKIVIACSRPGLIRGDIANPHVASYPVGHFTPDQLRQLVREPAITVVLGTHVALNADGDFVPAGSTGATDRMVLNLQTGALFDPHTELGDGVSDTGRASTLSPGVADALGVAQAAIKPLPEIALPAGTEVHVPHKPTLPPDAPADVVYADTGNAAGPAGVIGDLPRVTHTAKTKSR